MILDDDTICNFINTRVAETSGFFREIHSLFNGSDALLHLEQVSNGTVAAPDIILLDINMPVMNGFDFIDRLQRINLPNKDNVSIVILTSSDNMKDKKNAAAKGIRHYLQKPLTLKDLQSVVYSFNNTKKTGLKTKGTL
jgi:CheY-like chemotaxis protein